MRNYIVLILAVAGVFIVGIRTHFHAQPPVQKKLNVPRAMSDWSWTKAPWEASDSPYTAIQQDIDKQIDHGKSQADIIRETGNAFIENQHDSKLAFAWAYAFYGNPAFDAPHDRELARQICFGLIWAIKDKPVSYEYARMQFLVTKVVAPQTLLINLGERLIKKNPNDELVKFNLAGILAYGNQDQKNQAKEYAKYFSQHYPDTYGSHATWAIIYLVDSKFGEGNQKLADQAIAESKIALSYLPNDESHRGQRGSMTILPMMISNNRKSNNK